MEVVRKGEGLVRKPPAPNSPTINVIFGGEEGGPDVGLAYVAVPPGAAFPPHQHSGSDVIISPVLGSLVIRGSDDQSVEVDAGDHVLILKDEKVGLSNPTDEDAAFIVSAGPANFIGSIRKFPS